MAQQLFGLIVLDLAILGKEFKGTFNQVDSLLKKIRNDFYIPDNIITEVWLTKIEVFYPCKCNNSLIILLIYELDPQFYRGQKSFVIPKRGLRPTHTAKYMLFSSNFQLQCLMNSKYVFIDATFNSSPPGFKQTLHIIAIDLRTNLAVLVCTCLMQCKQSDMYSSILEDLKTKIAEAGGIFESHRFL